MRHSLYFAALILSPLALCMIGCSDDTVCCDQVCTGQPMIVGEVTGGFGPIDDAFIQADYLGPLHGYDAGFRCRTTASGTYEMDVSPGEYRLYLNSPSGGTDLYYGPDGLSSSRRDVPSVFVDSEQPVLAADFRLGAMELNFQLPELLATSSAYFYAEQYAEPDARFREYGNEDSETWHIVMEGLLPGYYRILFDPHLDNRGDLSYDPIDLSSLVDSIRVVAGEVATAAVVLPDPGTLSGVIGGDFLQQLDDRVYVNLYGPNEQRLAGVTVGAAGTYSVPIFLTQNVRLRLDIGDHDYWIGGHDFASANVYDIGPGLDVVVDSISIGGLVCRFDYDPSWNRGARLTILNQSGTWQTHVNAQLTETASVPLYAADSYSILVHWQSPTQWRPQWYDRATTPGQATPIEYDGAGEVTELDIVLEEGGRISGRVLNADESPASGIRLRVESSFQSMVWIGLWETDRDGRFLIEGLPDGEVTVGAYNPGLTWYPGVVERGLAEPILIEDAGTVENVEWTLITPFD